MRHKKLDSLGVSAFCESMAMMVQSGIQMDEAVGKRMSEAMEAAGIFPEYASGWWQPEREPDGWRTYCSSWPGIMRIRKP